MQIFACFAARIVVNLLSRHLHLNLMKYQTLSLALAALVAFTPAYAQSSRRATRGGGAAPAAAAEVNEPKTGVRFVICAPTGGKLPSPLYYKAGTTKGVTTYKKATISGRIPTQRIKPEAGVIRFYDQDPTPPADATTGNRRAPKAAPAELPKPVMEVSVPASAGSKSLCIVIPGETPSKAKTFFLNEDDFPTKGVHLINLSPRPVSIYTSTTNDLSKAKENKIGPYKEKEGISSSNSWHFTSGKHGEQVSFRITTRQTTKGTDGKNKSTEVNVRMGKFPYSENQGQVNIIVKDGKGDRLKLMSIQMSKD